MKSTVDTVDTATCNTLKSRAWSITWNNYSKEQLEWLFTYCEKICEKYTYQEEIGKEGTPHIQGALYYKNARSFKAVKDDFPVAIHIEAAKNWKALVNYCKKQDTKNGITVSSEVKPRFKFEIIDPLKEVELYDWQISIIEICKSPRENRKIWWFWEDQGCRGKTTLAKHICLNNNNALYVCGKSADMKYGVFQAVEEGIDISIIILDFTRSNEDHLGVYQGIEEIKNGIFYNTKYESKMCIFNSPHVICFANWKPKTERLSLDRWNIVEI